MNGRFFLDTNIFVYSFDRKAGGKARRALQLIREGVATRKAVVSYQVVQEFFNVALKRFDQPMNANEGEQYLSTVFRPILTVHSSEALIGQALRLCDRHHLAWYDALIIAGALESECSILYSEDLQHRQRFGDLQVKNPFL
jgi:predicted nucleic acid-binding protein